MSRFTKLIKNPKIFFIDAVRKRVEPAPKKPAPKKSAPKKSAPFIEIYQLNSFYPYKILLHTGEGANGITHMNLWIPIFKQSEADFVVLVRNYEVFNYLKENYAELAIIFAVADKEVKSILNKMPSLKACFYPSNTGNNLHLLSFDTINHVFIGHGDSDKTASAHKYFRVYDENWVAGEAHIDRFNNAGFNHRGLRHIKVGRPNLEETILLSQNDWKSRFDDKINLLYLSTWEGVYAEQEYTSVEIIKDFFDSISTLLDSVNINIKLHPWVGRRRNELVGYDKKIKSSWTHNVNNSFIKYQNMLKKDFDILKNYNDILNLNYYKFTNYDIQLETYSKETPVEELIKKANLFICDISAVISEALAGNAPIFVYIPKDKPIKMAQSNMRFEDYTYTFSSIDELKTKFKEVIIENNDYLADNREKAMEYILGKKETLENRFIHNLQCIEKGVKYDS